MKPCIAWGGLLGSPILYCKLAHRNHVKHTMFWPLLMSQHVWPCISNYQWSECTQSVQKTNLWSFDQFLAVSFCCLMLKPCILWFMSVIKKMSYLTVANCWELFMLLVTFYRDRLQKKEMDNSCCCCSYCRGCIGRMRPSPVEMQEKNQRWGTVHIWDNFKSGVLWSVTIFS